MNELADRVLEVARAAGRRAAHVCRGVLTATDGGGAMAKSDDSPVTIADYGSQAVILDGVRAAFPGHGVIAEEGAAALRAEASPDSSALMTRLAGEALGRPISFEEICDAIDHSGAAGSEYSWCIDPIDGTKGFLRREQYAVAIGVLRDSIPWAGVLVCPNLPVDLSRPEGARGVMFVAARGRGCTVEPLDGGEAWTARVTGSRDPAAWRVLGSVESAHGDPKLVNDMIAQAGIGGGFVRYDSQVKYGVVACGGAEVYLRPRSKPTYRENVWDHAAGVIVCEEAGGRVTDVDGKPLDFTKGAKLEDNRGVLGTAGGRVHEVVLEALRAIEARA
ncbi:MAG: inositol monophosphatase family protein [Planctomycetota bacterium]|nr:inositol monophosphatase family protein [Planctomycetota bacterium]